MQNGLPQALSGPENVPGTNSVFLQNRDFYPDFKLSPT
jgi:hypothetical protein